MFSQICLRLRFQIALVWNCNMTEILNENIIMVLQFRHRPCTVCLRFVYSNFHFPTIAIILKTIDCSNHMLLSEKVEYTTDININKQLNNLTS
jgi:hypothetical protein